MMITVSSADPHFFMPAVKTMLWWKNHLMCVGWTAEVALPLSEFELSLGVEAQCGYATSTQGSAMQYQQKNSTSQTSGSWLTSNQTGGSPKWKYSNTAHLRPTATSLDDLPARFLRLGAPIFASPAIKCLESSSTTDWRLSTTSTVYFRRIPVCYMDYLSYIITAS